MAIERLRAIPGVQQVGVSELMPLDRRLQMSTVFTVEGDLPAAADQAPSLDYCRIHRDYLETLHIPLLKGRGFNAYDTAQSPASCSSIPGLLNGTSAVGTRSAGASSSASRGPRAVAGDRRRGNARPDQGARTARCPQAYLHDMQSSPPFVVTFAVRTGIDFAALRPALEKAMREIAPSIPIYSAGTLSERFDASISTQRMMGLLLASSPCWLSPSPGSDSMAC